jgi:hypothetical protein
VFGCACRGIADGGSCSATTLRDRRDGRIACGAIEALRPSRLAAVGPRPGARFGVGGEALPEGASVHPDCGYDSFVTRERLHKKARAERREIVNEGQPAPPQAGHNNNALGGVERMNSSWHHNAREKKLARCTEREGLVIDSWYSVLGRGHHREELMREGWMRYL